MLIARCFVVALLALAGLAPSAWASPSPAPPSQSGPSAVRAYALRLRPGQDLKAELLRFAKDHDMRAGFVMSAVGSLKAARLRLANQPNATAYDGTFEIVALGGTLSREGGHMHLAIADGEGRTLGGHMVDGCTIYTTAEIVIGELETLSFERVPDPDTGYEELEIRPRQ